MNPLKGVSLEISGASTVTIPSSLVASSTAYVPTYGYNPLRDWIRFYMAKEHNYPHDVSTWDFIIGNGSQDLLQRAFDVLLDPEDTLLVEEYTYSGALAAVWPVGCKMVPIPMDDAGVDPDGLESLLNSWDSGKRPKAIYIVPTAHNPTGTSLSNDRKKRIYELACKYHLIIIEDDPYWNLNFTSLEEDRNRTTFWSMDIEQRVMRLESLSKITAVGYRVGWLCAPSKFIEKIGYDLEAGAQSGSGVAQLVVHELVKPLLGPGIGEPWEKHLEMIRSTYFKRWEVMLSALDRHLGRIAEWKSPRGGMFAWVKFPQLADTQEFVKLLANDYNVLTVPGAAFSCINDTKSPFIRLAFSYCEIDAIEPSIAKIALALASYTQLHQ